MEYSFKIESLLEELSLEEKVGLCSGFGPWSTKKIERLGIKPVFMSDGPHGPRWMKTSSYTQSSEWDMSSLSSFNTSSGYTDLLYPVTNFPSLASLGSSWNRELLFEVGKSIGEECRHLGIGLLLAPGVNIVRHPLCGRAFEYFSEDPVVAGEMGAAYVQGVQSTGVGATVKHYLCNNAEFERLSMDSLVEERALREIYLATFKRVVKKANPAMIMESYNKVNGVSMAENKHFLCDILKNEWGFKGTIISDWWAINDRVESFKAGLDLEMPQNTINDELLLDAALKGIVNEERIDDACRRIIMLSLKYGDLEKKLADFDKHHEIARKAATESIVLLKNKGNILPLDSEKPGNIAVIGSFAKKPRYQGWGCSIVNPRKLLTPLDEIEKVVGTVDFAEGYIEGAHVNEALLSEARKTAEMVETVILVVGLPEELETETKDREDYNVPKSHLRLINEISKVNERIIVVLQNGSAIAIEPWHNKVTAIIEAWLGGEAGASAIADILFGFENPSGKLALTFPKKIHDAPGYLNFPGENGKHVYQEGVFVGYRYYEMKDIEPMYPFGYGLSYTEFEYSNIRLSSLKITNDEPLIVSFNLTNTGEMNGREIAQMYISPHNSRLKRPIKELKNFEKVYLKKGETKKVTMILNGLDFSYYDDAINKWIVDSGTYTIAIGTSSAHIKLKIDVEIKSNQPVFKPLTGESYCYNLVENPIALEAFKNVMARNNLWPETITEEFIETIKHNFIPLFKSVTRQTGGKISRKVFDIWMEEVNLEIYKKMHCLNN
jgi:beta-glucosidase